MAEEYIQQQIPISQEHFVWLTAPKPMTQSEWDKMMEALKLWEQLWVQPAPTKQALEETS